MDEKDFSTSYQKMIAAAAEDCPDVPPGITICAGVAYNRIEAAIEATRAGDVPGLEECLNDAKEAISELYNSLQHFNKLRRLDFPSDMQGQDH